MTEKEIKDKAKQDHDTLSASYYAGTSGLTKEQFDLQHGQIWDDMTTELLAEGFIKPPQPKRDLEKEIDDLKVEIKKLKVGK